MGQMQQQAACNFMMAPEVAFAEVSSEYPSERTFFSKPLEFRRVESLQTETMDSVHQAIEAYLASSLRSVAEIEAVYYREDE